MRRTRHAGSIVIAVLATAALASMCAAPAAGAAAPVAPSRAAGDYPTRSIRMLVGFAPGGGTDLMARLFGQKFTEAWGQNVIVDNRVGAGGNIASEIAAKASPDGYTLLMVVSSIVINESLYRKIGYSTTRDFTPVSLAAVSTNVITVHPSVTVQNVRELIALARSKPGELTYASPGNGQASHLAMELLSSMAGMKLVHVPFNGGGPSIIAAVAGQTQVLTASLPTALPFIRSGKLRVMGVTSAQRTPLAPELPTIAEGAGLKGYDADVWYGLLAPAGTPGPIVAQLNAEMGRVLKQPEVRERFTTLGFEPAYDTPAQFAALIRADLAKWEKVVRDSGARAE
jgi:tripartite-type tricarboxylate transporter receptor subunit TctC